MITYNEIYEFSRKERYSEQLQPLPKNFLIDFSRYLTEKKQMLQEESHNEHDFLKANKQIENANTLFKELLLRRRKKIFQLVLLASEVGISKQDSGNMLTFEKELFEDCCACVERFEGKLSLALLGHEEQGFKHELVVFTEDMEAFVDSDEAKVGPFEKGQVANIPKEVAKILVDSGKAEVISDPSR